MSVTATARMKVVIEVDAQGSWGDKCQLDQVNSQAKEAVMGMLNRIARDNPGFRIIGTPIESSIMLTERK